MKDGARDVFQRASKGDEIIFGTRHERTKEIVQAFLVLDLGRQFTGHRKFDLQEDKADLRD